MSIFNKHKTQVLEQTQAPTGIPIEKGLLLSLFKYI